MLLASAAETDDVLVDVQLFAEDAACIDVEPHPARRFPLHELRFDGRVVDRRKDVGRDLDGGHAGLDVFEHESLDALDFLDAARPAAESRCLAAATRHGPRPRLLLAAGS